MPGFRELKDIKEPEVPASQVVRPKPAPVEPPAPLSAAAVDARKRIEERHAAAGPREAQSASSAEASPVVTLTAQTAKPLTLPAPLPEDFEAGLKALEGSVAMMHEQARSLMEAAVMTQVQLDALRLRAEADAGKLAKVNAALKALAG